LRVSTTVFLTSLVFGVVVAPVVKIVLFACFFGLSFPVHVAIVHFVAVFFVDTALWFDQLSLIKILYVLAVKLQMLFNLIVGGFNVLSNDFKFSSVLRRSESVNELLNFMLGVIKYRRNLLECCLELVLNCFVFLDESLDFSLGLHSLSLNFTLNFVVHCEGPHFKTFIIKSDVLLNLLVGCIDVISNKLKFGCVFWLIDESYKFSKTKANSIKVLVDLFNSEVEISFNLFVLFEESIDVLSGLLSLGMDFLEFLVVHRELPHIETLVVPLEVLNDLDQEGFLNFLKVLDLLLVLEVIVESHVFFGSLDDVLHFDGEIVLEVVEFGLDSLVVGNKLLPVVINLLVIAGDLLELIVVHVEFPHFETLVVEIKVSFHLSSECMLLLADGFELGLVLWLTEEGSSLL